MTIKRTRWSEEDIERFKSIYPTSTVAVLKEAFPGRTEQAFYLLASKLKLKKIREVRFSRPADEAEIAALSATA